MKTNILFIITDQLRADVLGCYGGRAITTPNIDQLCEDGRLYHRAVTPHPMCVPARASLLTGENAIVNGALDNEHWLRPDRKDCGVFTWPEYLNDAGYHTEAIGKMHFYPWDISEGFQKRQIAEDKRHIHVQDDYSEYLKQHGFEREHGDCSPGYHENKGATVSPVPTEHQIDRWVANRAVDFIKSRQSEEPFAVMVSFPGPHCPYDPPQAYLDQVNWDELEPIIDETEDSAKLRRSFIRNNRLPWNGVDYSNFSKEQRLKVKAHYCALTKQIDDCVGDVIQSLKEKGLYDDTLIVFTSDHGDLMGDYSMVGKQYFYEGSIRVPLIVKGQNECSGSTVTQTVSLTDLFATFLKTAGIECDRGTDSISLPESDDLVSREFIFGAINYGFMLTSNEWKLCRYTEEIGGEVLFNLKSDPHELHNLANDPTYAEVKSGMGAILNDRILESILRSHEEKRATVIGATGEGDFGKRGWQRAYPFPIDSAD
ncbi:MAG: sulfatase [Lentimonas sp.]